MTAPIKPVSLQEILDALRVAHDMLNTVASEAVKKWGAEELAREKWPSLYVDVDKVDRVIKAVEAQAVTPAPVTVAVWSHRNGVDVGTFSSPARAEERRQIIATDNWVSEMSPTASVPSDRVDRANKYFDIFADRMALESFKVVENVVVDENCLDRLTLFNGLQDYAEPDWSRFTYLKIVGCIYKSEGHTADDATSFRIYACADNDSAGVAITGCAALAQADRIGAILAQRSGLAVVDFHLGREGPISSGPTP